MVESLKPSENKEQIEQILVYLNSKEVSIILVLSHSRRGLKRWTLFWLIQPREPIGNCLWKHLSARSF